MLKLKYNNRFSMNSKQKKLAKQYKKIIKQEKDILQKKVSFFRKRFNLWKRKVIWHKVQFVIILIIIFSSFVGFWRYSLISAKAFIKIFPKTAEGSFLNIDKILTLSNSENADINVFSQKNSAYPVDFMKENIYSFEVNLKPEDLTTVLPSEEEVEIVTTTTTTILGSTEVKEGEGLQTNSEDENIVLEETTTTTTLEQEETTATTTLENSTETTTTTILEESANVENQTSKIKTLKPIIGFIGKYFKNNKLLGSISGIASNIVDTLDGEQNISVNGEVVLSGFVLPELLEDDVLTQFDDRKKGNEVLNVKLGISLASRHINQNSKAGLDVEIFLKDKWEKIDEINLNQDISNSKIGTYYYIGLNNVNSVEDIETLKIRLLYYNDNSNDKDRLYIDGSWIEVAINSDTEAIINENFLETKRALAFFVDKFYDFDQEVTVVIPKEQIKTQKVYKTDIVAGDSIVDGQSKTIIVDSPSGGSSGTNISDEQSLADESDVNAKPSDEESEINGAEDLESSVNDAATEDLTVSSGDESQVEPSLNTDGESSLESNDSAETSSSESASSLENSAPAENSSSESATPSTEGQTSWFGKITKIVGNMSKRLVASVLGLIDEVTPETTTTLEEESVVPTTQDATSTTIEQSQQESTSGTETSTTTIELENNEDVLDMVIPETTAVPEESTYQAPEDNSLVAREESVAMQNFKIRSAILSTPDRRKFRNNISISENEKEYIITVKHGPELIPGKYNLIIKYQEQDGYFMDSFDFVWGGKILKEIKIIDNVNSFFVEDLELNQSIYLQIQLEENLFYHLKVQNVVVPIDTPIGFIENNFVFLDENSNMQGLDILSNSFFSQVLENNRDNYFNINNNKYLIKIENGMILFVRENN